MDIAKLVDVYIRKEDIDQNKLSKNRIYELMKALPDDATIVGFSHSTHSHHVILRIFSDKFLQSIYSPSDIYLEIEDSSYLGIKWPLHLKHLEKTDSLFGINATSYETFKAGAPAPALTMEMIEDALKKTQDNWKAATDMQSSQSTCNHEWYTTSKYAAFKHCKKCHAIAENTGRIE